ncbi:ANL_HP_G0130690.mRNA.1.CDS.1 [Saccharomyces cerevisiae]|nr:ANL_HP_G0184670.mRNA.1.CDS.1 [Saccharomyces cerevisiae]CAI5177861.1 ANL_HP_G0130690.mRNA.1.CDS.1 [Saccharomyces cerevisiae]CAI6379304.1 ANL_HP_G0184670.mRNA.1.CDS.1 [Saccharomyces cerevisiae]CAI6999806.1 ANL_HP_G0130690.mRNA.1.CDS.1 [Saccharomyces cerevisiae]
MVSSEKRGYAYGRYSLSGTSAEGESTAPSQKPRRNFSALVSTATVTVDDVITQYTTWCPLTTEAPKNTTSPAPTEKPTEKPTQQGSSTQTVTSYTGAAAKALPAAGALLAGAAALLL